MPREQYEIRWKDYYEVLQVHPKAEDPVIQAAYRKLTQMYHPDRAGPSNNARMAEINEAHEVLSDTQRRARYDQVYQTRATGTAPAPDLGARAPGPGTSGAGPSTPTARASPTSRGTGAGTVRTPPASSRRRGFPSWAVRTQALDLGNIISGIVIAPFAGLLWAAIGGIIAAIIAIVPAIPVVTIAALAGGERAANIAAMAVIYPIAIIGAVMGFLLGFFAAFSEKLKW